MQAADGLPLVVDELARQVSSGIATGPGLRSSTLTVAVLRRMADLSPEGKTVVDALAVLGEVDATLLAVTCGVDPATLITALRELMASTMLVPADNELGVTWRHALMRAVVRDQLLPLERMQLAHRAADHLAARGDDLSESQARSVAGWYEAAGETDSAAHYLILAARAAIRAAALNAAESYLRQAASMVAETSPEARDATIEQIQALAYAGRADEATTIGLAAIDAIGAPAAQPLAVVTARVAFGAGFDADGERLLQTLSTSAEPADVDIAVLEVHSAAAQRSADVLDRADRAAQLAERSGRFDVACEALVLAGRAGRKHDTGRADAALRRALAMSVQHQLPLWEVRALSELGLIQQIDSDPSTLIQARARAEKAGMAGTAASLNMRIGETTSIAQGYVASYLDIAAADEQARQLRLTGLYARTRVQLAACFVHADDQPLPGHEQPAPSSIVDDLVQEGIELGSQSRPLSWPLAILGFRAWYIGDDDAAVRLLDEGFRDLEAEIKVIPWWGVNALIRVAIGVDDPDTALGPDALIGHHANHAARLYAAALGAQRRGEPTADTMVEEADRLVAHTPFMQHHLRVIIAPHAHRAGMPSAVGWLREADAFCLTIGERALRRRIRQGLTSAGAKIPRTRTNIGPRLARIGVTARESEVLTLVNEGLSNTEIGRRLFLSPRTVESHVSSLLRKSGCQTRSQLIGIDSKLP